MITKKGLVFCIVTALICLAVGITCAIIRSFDVVSVILFAVVIILAIIIAISAWREVVNQKKDGEQEN